MFNVYILKCNDQSFYTGHTDDLDTRLAQHQQAYFNSCYTAKRLPVELVYQAEFNTREEALILERQIKGWSRKKKKIKLLDPSKLKKYKLNNETINLINVDYDPDHAFEKITNK